MINAFISKVRPLGLVGLLVHNGVKYFLWEHSFFYNPMLSQDISSNFVPSYKLNSVSHDNPVAQFFLTTSSEVFSTHCVIFYTTMLLPLQQQVWRGGWQ